MKDIEFVYWLKGYMQAAGKKDGLNQYDTEWIKHELQKCFQKVTHIGHQSMCDCCQEQTGNQSIRSCRYGTQC